MDQLPILWAVLGIGLVIFVHEAGHFLAARLCRVRVEVFSLGFGPRLVSWRRGSTTYQIAAVPLGGYVRMAGEEPPDRDGEARPPAPDELGSKSVAQRFFIYSGGVLMNVLFALVVFPFVLAVGVPCNEPVLGPTVPGSPAWRARLPEGTRVLSVNGSDVFDYFHIPTEVALSGDDPVDFRVLRPGASAPSLVTLVPERAPGASFFRVGVTPGYDAQGRLTVAPDGPAAEAGLEDGDRLLAVVGGLPHLPLSEQLALAVRSREPVALRVERSGTERTVTVVPRRAEDQARVRLIGVEPVSVLLEAVRPDPAIEALGLVPGDRILSVGGREVLREGDVARGLLASRGPLHMVVERGGEELELRGPALDEAAAADLAEDLWVAPDRERTRIAVLPDSAADRAGVLDGDTITALDGTPVGDWTAFQELARLVSKRERPVRLDLLRRAGGSTETAVVELVPELLVPLSYGFALRPAEYVYQAADAGEALRVGVSSSWRFLVESWRTLRRMATGEVGTENLGGIITIGVVSHSWASKGLSKLFFFLCLLSMNLAFLNVLPIPVLDGGHLFFLLVEGIKGSPVSERTLGYSQIVGLVLIVSLMVYVTYNDVARWFFGS